MQVSEKRERRRCSQDRWGAEHMLLAILIIFAIRELV